MKKYNLLTPLSALGTAISQRLSAAGRYLRRDKDDSIAARIENAGKYHGREEGPQPVRTASPAVQMTGWRYPAGWLLRFLIMLCGVYGASIFWNDAVRIVVLSGKKAISAFTLPANFFLMWSIAVCVLVSAAALTKLCRIVVPICTVGGGILYLVVSTGENPILYIADALLRLWNLILENLALIGYTTYVRYQYTGTFFTGGEPAALLRCGAAVVTIVYGLLLCMTLVRRAHPIPLALLLAGLMVPVFLFNITETNTGAMLLFVFICASITVCVFDFRFDGRQESRKSRKLARKQKKEVRKASRKVKKDASVALKQSAENAYRTTLAKNGDRKTARDAKRSVLLKAKKHAAEEKRIEKQKRKRRKADEYSAKLAEKKNRHAAALAAKKSQKTPEERKQRAAERAQIAKERRLSRQAHRAEIQKSRREENKRIACGGFAGGMALLIAFCAIWLPYSVIKKNFPIVDVINNKMQIARMYVTAYLMGDDVDLNSLSLYGGVAELNPRTIDFDTPQYTGKKIFTLDAGYAAPVYMRSWIGSDYDMESDTWISATPEEVVDYRERFGSAYTPDHITYFFNKFVYPKSVDITRFDQYRNLDDYGFRVFQINVRRESGASKLLFVPAFLNTGLGLMQYGSIQPVDKKYSAYYDGIYSSRFFGENTAYSTSSFVTTMKSETLAENYEKSIQYYNTAADYMELIDTLEESAEQGVYYITEDNFVLLTSGGVKLETDAYGRVTDTSAEEIRYVIDNEAIAAQFEKDMTAIGYKWEGESLVRRYLAMEAADRKQFRRSYDTEIAYRQYVSETYTASFGSEAVKTIADMLLDEAGITNLDKGDTADILRNGYESPFVNQAGQRVPRHTVVLSVIDYLRENFTYTLEPAVPSEPVLDENGEPLLDENGDPVTSPTILSESNLDAFLTEVREGYCVHFATAAVGILRDMGFAVRYDEGYIAARWNRTYAADAVARYRTSVRDYDAHAWIEVYYPCIGWVQYETTPSFCEAIYDADVQDGETTTSSSSYYRPSGEETLLEDITTDVTLGTEDEKDRAIFITIVALAVVLLVYLLLSVILRFRANRKAEKRTALVRQTSDREAFLTGRTDIHTVAHALIDYVFAVYRALGCPPETGELPHDYALRLQETFGELSTITLPAVMEIIEKEEFGGELTFAEFTALGEYIGDMERSVYAGASLWQKIRMRYILALL